MTQLGKYTLEKRIGSGGMADVWLARGPKGLCVIKAPHRHLCDNPEFVKMFLDEASLLAQLHHPNIAQIYDLGQEKGAYYLAMEYVPGFDLMTISLEHERHGELMSVELCARIVADAASALHYAHEAKDPKGQPLNIVHRDVTPHNILLSRQGLVKLIDFGVAKASTTMHRTQAGFVKGKYPYMSPEQITGQIIDRRVDVYALGLVLYELLTNVRAIPGNTEIEQIDAARAGKIRPIEMLRPNIPVPIRQILGACLHFDPSGRYPTALALKEDLEKYLSLERQVVGQEDLLRLFRIVAADTGETPSDRRTELEQPASGDGPVVVPDAQAGKAMIDELGYSPTAPSMKSVQAVPLQLGQEARPTAQVSSTRPPTSSLVAPVSRTPLFVLTGLSISIIVMVLALWKPWAGPVVTSVVDAGETISGKIDKFDFPPPEVVDSGAAVVTPEPVVDAGAAVVEAVIDAGVEKPTNVDPTPVAAKVGTLSLATTVPAMVTVDGKDEGATPLELELPPGNHVVQVHGEGIDRKLSFKLKAGEKKTFTLGPAKSTPTPPPNTNTTTNPPPENPPAADPGTIEVHASPFCTMIKVDGADRGPGSVLTVKVKPGSHKVECVLTDDSLPAPKVEARTLSVQSGQVSRVDFSML